MSDTKRMTADEQLGAFAGCRVTVCRCVGCRINFLSLHSHAKWCSAGCRKAAYKDRKATGAVPPPRPIKRAPEPATLNGRGRCVHCNGKVRLRSNDAICGMCGLNFDGA